MDDESWPQDGTCGFGGGVRGNLHVIVARFYFVIIMAHLCLWRQSMHQQITDLPCTQ